MKNTEAPEVPSHEVTVTLSDFQTDASAKQREPATYAGES